MSDIMLHNAIQEINLAQMRENPAKISGKYLKLATEGRFTRYERECATRCFAILREKTESALKDARDFYREGAGGLPGRERAGAPDREKTLWNLLGEWKRCAGGMDSFCMENARSAIFSLPFHEVMRAFGLGHSVGIAVVYSEITDRSTRMFAMDGSPCSIMLETGGEGGMRALRIGSFNTYETSQREDMLDTKGRGGIPLPLVGVEFKEGDAEKGTAGRFAYTAMRIRSTISGQRIHDFSEDKVRRLFKYSGHDFGRFIDNAVYKLAYGGCGFDRNQIEQAVKNISSYSAILRPATEKEWLASQNNSELSIDLKINFGMATGNHARAVFTLPEMAPHLIVVDPKGGSHEIELGRC